MPKTQSTENSNTKDSKVEKKIDHPKEKDVEQQNNEKINKKIKNIPTLLKKSHFENSNNNETKVDYSNPFIEIGVDEAGRGPMFGRVYIGAVVLPKDDNKFDFSKMKDSKKFHSEKKIKEVAEYIKKNAIAWSVVYAEHDEIDKSNIRRATIDCMHKAINDVIIKLKTTSEKVYLLIDGNDFIPMMKLSNESYIQIPHLCIEGGDNKYAAIAAASILAKVSRDEYIHEMCKEHADLNIKYDLISNKGYGTKKHMDGIKEHGISKWHRKSFGICREFS
jgi:ribonuclease HII